MIKQQKIQNIESIKIKYKVYIKWNKIEYIEY